jgi:hypothetical protein
MKSVVSVGWSVGLSGNIEQIKTRQMRFCVSDITNFDEGGCWG